MSDRLDTLLEAVREPEVFDEAFVQRVMRDVRADEQRRSGRRALRRPMVMGLAAAAIVTGGAVAAVVGSNPTVERRDASVPRTTTSITVTEPPRVATSDGETRTKSSAAPVAPRSSAAAAADPLTDHSSSVTDEKTGLRVQTESYKNAFEVSKPQRVTVTLENTGEYPIAISGPRGCTMQVMAVPAGEEAGDGLGATAYGGRFAWACAGSEEDPRVQAAEEKFVLAPGERRSADARIALSQAGEWDITGVCRCSFAQVRPTPVPKDRDPVTGLLERSIPPVLPESTQGQNLSTPPIRVRAG